jgi:Uma2 family endonuclease
MSAPFRTRRWSRLEYERLIEKGVFPPGERLELIAGELVVREPQRSQHATAIRAVEEALRAAFGTGWDVRVQLPLALEDASEPEPDVAVVRGGWWDYRDAHPTESVLIVEVAEASLAFDRQHKGGVYARAALPEYWIINLVDRMVEIYRDPAPFPSMPHGWQYRNLRSLGPDGAVSPLAVPSAVIRITDLLP